MTIVDVETTGMRPYASRVIDIGIIRIEHGKIVRTYQTLVNPGVSIPRFISNYVGITDQDIANAPPFEEIALEVESLFKDSVFVAHNASFDYSFIKSEFKRLGISFAAPTLCSVQLSRALFPKSRGHSLDAVIDRHGLVCESRHRAYPDADVIRQFFDHLAQTHDHSILQGAIDSVIGAGVAAKFNRKTLSDIPDNSGVYFFYGADRELLYVGKSKHMRTRTRSHFARRDNPRMIDSTVSVEVSETPGELSALLLESELIKKESPTYNRALRKKRELVTVKKITDDHGYNRLEIARTKNLIPTPDILAIFRTMEQARTKLRSLAHEYNLCEKLLGLEKCDRACFSSHLGICKGACTGLEHSSDYNQRFDEAFANRRIKTWPYSGGVIINEQGSDEHTGAVFFVDQWVLMGSFKYDETGTHEFLDPGNSFDYDLYKILVRFILHPSNKRSIKTVSKKEFDKAIRHARMEQEESVVSYD